MREAVKLQIAGKHKEIFSKFDTNNNGWIDGKELSAVLSKLDFNVRPSTVTLSKCSVFLL